MLPMELLLFVNYFIFVNYCYKEILLFITIPKNCNHKRLGLFYLFLSLLYGISGILLSIIIRIELYLSGNKIINNIIPEKVVTW